MVDENVEALDEVDDDEELLEEVDDADGIEPDEQPDEKLALLEQRLAVVEGQNSKLVRDFTASVGRVQSLIDRVESGRTADTAKLTKQVSSAVGAVEQQLDAILASDIVDPEIRARAQQARDRMRAETDLASLRDEITELKNRPAVIPPTPVSNELSPLERNVHTMIAEANLKIEDFDWDEANAVLGSRGEPGIYAYFTNKIAEQKQETAASGRRQARKASAGSGTPTGAGAGGDVASKLEHALDSGNLDDAVAQLQKLGVNPF
jgi:hypothetical protein